MAQKPQKQRRVSPKERAAENYRGLSILREEKLDKNDYSLSAICKPVTFTLYLDSQPLVSIYVKAKKPKKPKCKHT
jgi:hypothetical protein